MLAQLSLFWSRALLQLGPKTAAKEKPRQPSVQKERDVQSLQRSGSVGRRGEGLLLHVLSVVGAKSVFGKMLLHVGDVCAASHVELEVYLTLLPKSFHKSMPKTAGQE